MRDSWPCKSVLLLVLLAAVAGAQDFQPRVRNLYLSGNAHDAASRIYVGSRIATILCFEQDVDPAQTKLLGWEGWFEPLLVGARFVVLVPLQRIPSEDRFLLRVTLKD